MDIQKLKEKYVGKKFKVAGNTAKTIEITDIDELFMTAIASDKQDYTNKTIKYPLTGLPVMYEA